MSQFTIILADEGELVLISAVAKMTRGEGDDPTPAEMMTVEILELISKRFPDFKGNTSQIH